MTTTGTVGAVSTVHSCVQCAEQLTEPSFFRKVAAMAGLNCGGNRRTDQTYERHTPKEKRHVRALLRKGTTCVECARLSGIKLGTVSKWRQTFIKEGTLQKHKRK